MLTEDWMMRQVDALARSIAYLVFQKESTGYVPAGAAEDAALDELHRRCWRRSTPGTSAGRRICSLRRAIPTTGVIWSWRWTSMPGSTT